MKDYDKIYLQIYMIYDKWCVKLMLENNRDIMLENMYISIASIVVSYENRNVVRA